MSYTFAQIQHAYQVQDPALVDMLVALSAQPDPTPTAPIPEDELTFERFLKLIFSPDFRQKHPEVQFAERVAMIAKLEADEGVYPLPDRFKIHVILQSLYEDGSDYARAILLTAIERLPLSYGVWKGFKGIFKQAEARNDYAIFAPLAVRIDMERFDQSARTPVSVATKTYMSLRAWRLLRNIGEQSGFLYPQVATTVLACYPERLSLNSSSFNNTWVLKHICFHNSLAYGVSRFRASHKRKLFDEKGRAFAETWQRDSEPLLTLIRSAKNEAVRQFATDSLKADFKNPLREVSVATVQAISAVSTPSNAKDELLVWLISNSPYFEQSQFRALGLHEVVLKLLFSNFSQASSYAFEYAKSYAPDLPLSTLLLLIGSSDTTTREFAMSQILSRDPRTEIGIEAWGQLLNSPFAKTASEQIITHFSRRELTPDWFFTLLTSQTKAPADFAIAQLPTLYRADELGVDYFLNVIEQLDTHYPAYQVNKAVMQFCLNSLKDIGLEKVPANVWQTLLLHPLAKSQVTAWFEADVLHINALPMAYWHALAYEPDWQKSDWVKHLITAKSTLTTSELLPKNQWQRNVSFDNQLAEQVRTWLADVRRVVPVTLGFEWLMTLAKSSNSEARHFAIDRINKGFLPADFAVKDSAVKDSATEQPAPEPDADITVTVDLAQQSFLFTGKMQSMTRETAETMVTNANGKILGAVNNKLDYLVIGDDGSPLYGNGRKGSKQVKAEELIEKGASLKIISETAFLQMLSGQTREIDSDQTLAGAERLWEMAVSDPDSPMSELATTYLTHHHAELCLALTDRPVDPDAVIPNEFFSPERVITLLNYGNTRLRQFALQLMQYEFSRWQLTPEEWVKVAESPHSDVQAFISEALLSHVTAENRRYHQGIDKLSANMLYALLDSQQRFARKLGVTLLMRYPEFHDPQILYRLTESTDREVRYASVKMLWQHYRKRELPETWQPKASEKTMEQANDKTATAEKSAVIAHSKEPLPATLEQLLLLLKRGLFELPPARFGDNNRTTKPNEELPKAKPTFYHGKVQPPKPNPAEPSKSVSASRAKIALIETYRDVALEDSEFAEYVLPLLSQFTQSAGKMERHACLVAVTRIVNEYPTLKL